MKRLIALAFTALALTSPAFAKTLKVAEDTSINLELLDSVSSSTSGQGQVVNFRVLEDIRVGRDVVIEKGAKAKALVTFVDRRADFGKGGKVAFMFKSVKAVDGTNIPITGAVTISGEDKNMFWRVFWLGPMANSTRGNDASAESGRTFMATVDNDTEVEIPDSIVLSEK